MVHFKTTRTAGRTILAIRDLQKKRNLINLSEYILCTKCSVALKINRASAPRLHKVLDERMLVCQVVKRGSDDRLTHLATLASRSLVQSRWAVPRKVAFFPALEAHLHLGVVLGICLQLPGHEGRHHAQLVGYTTEGTELCGTTRESDAYNLRLFAEVDAHLTSCVRPTLFNIKTWLRKVVLITQHTRSGAPTCVCAPPRESAAKNATSTPDGARWCNKELNRPFDGANRSP